MAREPDRRPHHSDCRTVSLTSSLGFDMCPFAFCLHAPCVSSMRPAKRGISFFFFLFFLLVEEKDENTLQAKESPHCHATDATIHRCGSQNPACWDAELTGQASKRKHALPPSLPHTDVVAVCPLCTCFPVCSLYEVLQKIRDQLVASSGRPGPGSMRVFRCSRLSRSVLTFPMLRASPRFIGELAQPPAGLRAGAGLGSGTR